MDARTGCETCECNHDDGDACADCVAVCAGVTAESARCAAVCGCNDDIINDVIGDVMDDIMSTGHSCLPVQSADCESHAGCSLSLDADGCEVILLFIISYVTIILPSTINI